MAATRYNLAIRNFHTSLCQCGKTRKVALVAAMSKLLRILTACDLGSASLAAEPLSTTIKA